MTAGSNTPDNEADDEFENLNGNYFPTLTNYGLVNAEVLAPAIVKYAFKQQKGFMPVKGRILYDLANHKSDVLNSGDGTSAAKPYRKSSK